jgi:hypothetical protein
MGEFWDRKKGNWEKLRYQIFMGSRDTIVGRF